MNFAVIVEGNSAIGLGHVFRCINLVERLLSEGHNVCVYIPNIPKVEFILREKGITTYNFFIDTFTQVNSGIVADLNRHLCKSNTDVVVLDLLEESFVKFEGLRQNNTVIIVSITSFLINNEKRYEHISFFPDFEEDKVVEVNHHYGAMKLFSGKSFFMFRGEFEKRFPSKRINVEAPQVLITMGGADPYNLSLKVLKSLELSELPIEIIVIIGAVSVFRNEILRFSANSKNKITVLDQVKNIEDYMHHADIAFINGGVTRYELCVVGTPFIAISIHEKQYSITKKLTDVIGLGNLGVYDKLDESDIFGYYESVLKDVNLLERTSAKMKNVFHLNGIKMITDIILDRVNEGS
ncbi:hypothetical protein [Persicobacter sp. CCB-QB2]|uniref:hypothetical protein n=1 Tax=Persicobacter sp. CCB-QB2 TaxID=1561025 RepID=UPI0006A9F815|nr:hypothetical protein [Persicobacter sp. CCB-QB2]